jgi:hypothetical protein
VTTGFEDLSGLSEFHADVAGFSGRRRLLSELDAELGVDRLPRPASTMLPIIGVGAKV